MREIEKRKNQGFEIELYYPKENGRYTSNTGNVKKVIQCDNVGEVAQFFARDSWAAPFGSNNYANPTVWYNGQKWCFTEYSTIQEDFFYKGFVIRNIKNNNENFWEVRTAADGTVIRECITYKECIERIDNQII